MSKHTPKERVIHVKVQPVEQKNVPLTLNAIGQLTAFNEIDVKAQVSGAVVEVYFQDGQFVEEGTPMYLIDPRPFEADLKEAQAALKQNQAELLYAKQFEHAYSQLVDDAYVSRLDYERAVQNVSIYEAAIEKDIANIEKAMINLGYTKIYSPVRGYTSFNQFDPGNFVDAAAKSTLVTIRQITPLKASFSVAGKYLQPIRRQHHKSPLPFKAYLDRKKDIELNGVLTNIDNSIDPMTGMVAFEGTIPNDDEEGWPGQFVYVVLDVMTLENALVVPKQSILRSKQESFIYIVKDEVAHRINVDVVYEWDGISVIEGEVHQNDQVVIDGMGFLKDQAKVSVK